jgi:hypothetical protein
MAMGNRFFLGWENSLFRASSHLRQSLNYIVLFPGISKHVGGGGEAALESVGNCLVTPINQQRLDLNFSD